MSRFSLLRRGHPAITHDIRFGTATDGNGWIAFGLKAGCRRVWCDSTSGSDANDGLSSATPKATLSAAAALFKGAGHTPGDQLMLAGTGARTYSDTGGLMTVCNKSGDSLTYPSVVMSYDPADASNSAKYGQLLGANRPQILHPTSWDATGSSAFTVISAGVDNIFYKGLEFVGAFQSSVGKTSAIGASGKHNGIGIQNCLFNQCRHALDLDETLTTANWGSTFHVSKSAGYGQWSTDGNNSWLYISGTNDCIVEDCVGVHCGWKMGASRDDALSSGGAHFLGHGIYMAAENSGFISRRNIGIDNAQDMFSFRGNFTANCHVSVDEPLVMTFCGYSGSYTENPTGSTGVLRDATAMGGALISTADGGGGAYGARNALSGSLADNLALFDNPEKGTGGDKLWAGANDNPTITVAVAISNMRSYNYSTTFEGANSGIYPISLNYTNCQTDTAAPRGTGNSTWGSAPAGYQTRDQVITTVLTAMGVTPGASYTARKAQLVNYLLEYPDLAGQVAMAIDTIGLQSLGLSPTTHPTTTAPSVSGLTAPRSVY